jgi:membrane-associated phospholipid phosphatase
MKKHTFLKKTIFVAIGISCFHISYGQDSTIRKIPVYSFCPAVEIPVGIARAAWCAYSATWSYSKGASSQEQILALNKNNINPLDRGAIYPYNQAVDKFSYYPFYTAIPLPLIFFLTGKNMRKDYIKLTLLYAEALSVTGFLGYSATFFVDRYRPYTYSAQTSMDQKMNQNAKNSFFAGHVEVIAVSTFFIASVYSAYYPESKVKWVFFALAGAASLGMGYLRLDAGMHFPSDILLGLAAGALSGTLIPYFHNHRIIKSHSRKLIAD